MYLEENIIVEDSDTYFYTQLFFHKSDRFQSRWSKLTLCIYLSSIKVMNEWICASTPPYAIMTRTRTDLLWFFV